MAKHPVPKKKTAVSSSKSRYAAYVLKKHVKLQPFTNVKPCPNCGKLGLLSLACSNCGKYRGRQVIDMKKKIEKITKIKA